MTPDQISELIMPIAFIAVGLALAAAVARYAKKRGRRAWLWFLVSLIVNPLIAWLILAVVPDKSKKAS